MTDVLTPPQRSYCMSRIKGKNTGPEVQLKRALWQSGLRYRVLGKVTGKPDLFFPRQRLAVFVDGCFWHGCPEHYKKPVENSVFWEKKIKGNIIRDNQVNSELISYGWTVLRFWEHQIAENLDACVTSITETLKKH